MLESAAQLLRERGAAAVTVDEVLVRSGAPRGSVYHHFPGGRAQLLREALEYAGLEITASIDGAAGEKRGGAVAPLRPVLGHCLVDSDYQATKLPGAGRRRRIR